MSENFDERDERELKDIEHDLMKTFSDEEICKMADQGEDPAADHIYYVVWGEAKRKSVREAVDRKWRKQWDRGSN